MRTRIIRPDEYRVTAWRNGAGTTAEIAHEAGDGDRFAWRLSVADVPESGPFSDYAGYERIIAVVEGAGMRLRVGESEPAMLTARSAPYAFSGNMPTVCALLAGPIRDFNLIFDPALVRGAVLSIDIEEETVRLPLPRATVLIYAATGDLRLELSSTGPTLLPEKTALRIDDAAGLVSIGGLPGGRALVVTIER